MELRKCTKCGKPFYGYALCPACRADIDRRYAEMMKKQQEEAKKKASNK
jgi:hypothetical protein